MKVNLHWLASFVDLKLERDELLRRVNAQLGEIEAVVDCGQKYVGATIVEVAGVSPNPGDGLCLIDDKQKLAGVKRQKDGLVQVFCNDPNLTVGTLAVWLPPGSIVPASFDLGAGKRVKLATREIRGVLSQGMLASAFELDLGPEKETVLALGSSSGRDSGGEDVGLSKADAGRPFAEVFHLDTEVIEIENKMFTNRPDCFGLIGVAREVAAITGSAFKNAELRNLYFKAGGSRTAGAPGGLKLDVRCPELVARFQARIIRGVKVGASENIYERALLASVGLKPVNNVVDKTNLVMHLSGQPTHAFDLDKLAALSNDTKGGLELFVRRSEPGEKLALLNGKELTFDQPAVVIATDREPVALGGIMGGISTEVDSKTENILLECANFSMYDIRRTTMRYGVFSEAATRFTKCQSPGQIPGTATAASSMIARQRPDPDAEAEVEVYEFAAAGPMGIGPLSVGAAFVNRRLGTDLSAAKMAELLRRTEFGVKLKGKDVLEIEVPFWRTDIGIAEDIIEEIGRLNGYGEIKPVLPRRPTRPPAADKAGRLLEFKDQLRRLLAGQGANETVAHSFVAGDFVRRTGQDPDDCFRLTNPLNPRLEVYRQSLTPSLSALAEANRRAGWRQFALFEIGSVHQKSAPRDEEGLPLDLQRSALLYCDGAKGGDSPFFVARRYLDLLAVRFGLHLNYRPMSENLSEGPLDMETPYDPPETALVSCRGRFLGIVGILKAGGGRFAGWELETDVLLELAEDRAAESVYRPLAKYPGSSQDLTLKISSDLPYARLEETLEKALAEWRKKNWRAELRLLSIFKPPTSKEQKHVSFRLSAGHEERSIRKGEISEILAALVEAAAEHAAEQVV